MTDPAHKLANILQAIQDEEKLFSEVRAAHKLRLETLHNQAYTLKDEILTGQMPLPVDEEEKADGKSQAAGGSEG